MMAMGIRTGLLIIVISVFHDCMFTKCNIQHLMFNWNRQLVKFYVYNNLIFIHSLKNT